ncbi:MAG: aminoacyl-tRNA hydrolase [Robiginitomaculum sp.]|nr:aminoacyl-tRNA hydrolase [Robiginitomaculum sp.]
MLKVNSHTYIPLSEIEFTAVRAQGPGGQHVNKTNSAIHLRFDVMASSLPDTVKQKILAINDRRLTDGGIIIIKSQSTASQLRNKQAALARLSEMLATALKPVKKRRPTKPSKGAVQRRLKKKTQRSQIKITRRKPGRED